LDEVILNEVPHSQVQDRAEDTDTGWAEDRMLGVTEETAIGDEKGEVEDDRGVEEDHGVE